MKLSQNDLIALMQMIMIQNIKISNNLHTSLWNYFFSLYYQLNQQDPDDSKYDIITLLSCMKLEGSNAYPDIDTFAIILSGIMEILFNIHSDTHHVLDPGFK